MTATGSAASVFLRFLPTPSSQGLRALRMEAQFETRCFQGVKRRKQQGHAKCVSSTMPSSTITGHKQTNKQTNKQTKPLRSTQGIASEEDELGTCFGHVVLARFEVGDLEADTIDSDGFKEQLEHAARVLLSLLRRLRLFDWVCVSLVLLVVCLFAWLVVVWLIACWFCFAMWWLTLCPTFKQVTVTLSQKGRLFVCWLVGKLVGLLVCFFVCTHHFLELHGVMKDTITLSMIKRELLQV
jgi:hypothetical protein